MKRKQLRNNELPDGIRSSWDLQSRLMIALLGNRMAFALDNDPVYSWIGRLSVWFSKKDSDFKTSEKGIRLSLCLEQVS